MIPGTLEKLPSTAHCPAHCLQHLQLSLSSTTIEIPDVHLDVHIPKAYIEFADVFSKAKVNTLSQQQSYACTIDLLPGTTPDGEYTSLQEQKAMEECILKALSQGYTAPSYSPVGRLLLCRVGLRPCVAY